MNSSTQITPKSIPHSIKSVDFKKSGPKMSVLGGHFKKGPNSDIRTKNPEWYPAFSDSAQKVTLKSTLKTFVGEGGRFSCF